MAGVIDGQPVSAAVTNPAFIIKNDDDTMPNKLSFTDPGEGSDIDSIQQATNNLYDATGVSEVADGTTYNAPANTITNGQSHETSLSELADKFDPITGHNHDGTAGQGAPVSASGIGGVPLEGMFILGTDLVGVTGSSSDLSTQFLGKSVSLNQTQVGVVVSSPYNKSIVRASANDDLFIDASGNVVYGRVTNLGGASGAWSLSYYSEVSGSETSYSFISATGVRFYYQQLFSQLDSTYPSYDQLAIVSPQSRVLHSIAASSGTRLYGDVRLIGVSGVTLSQSGQDIQITSTSSGGVSLSNTAPQSIGSSNSAGTGPAASRDDHVHQGIHSVSVSSQSQLFSDVTFSPGTGISMSQVSQNIQIVNTGVLSIAASGFSALTGAVTIAAGSGVTLSEVGQVITISASGTGGGSSFTSGIRNINNQSSNTYTFALPDGSGNGNSPLVTFSSASSVTATVPNNTTVAFPVGSEIDVVQTGSGSVTFAGASGVTVQGYAGSMTMLGQHTGVSLYKTATNTWELIGQLALGVVATGGNITTITVGVDTYKVHTFLSSGNFVITAGTAAVESLIVAGGGGSGTSQGGGGGGGGVLWTTPGSTYGPGTYAVVVGAGGAAGSNGVNSSFDTLSAIGGGAGGANGVAGSAGGSGGGAGSWVSGGALSGGAGTAGQGNAGGNSNTSSASGNPGAGGGGAGAVGQTTPSTTVAGNGGNGLANSISGSSITYAGGGGGGAGLGFTGGTGGTGGGGNGTAAGAGSPGTANTGGGGGSGQGGGSGATGGSGIVIVRYKV